MTTDQLTGLARQLLPIAGGIAVTLGWLTPTQVGTITTNVAAAAGPLAILGGMAWSWIANSRKSILQSVNAMKDVKAIVTTNQSDVRDSNLPKAVSKVSDAP